MLENKEKTSISSLGEFGLIDLIKKNVKLKNSSSLIGIGDDCAIINTEKKKIVITKDILNENIHFRLSYCPLKHLGYKSVIVNLSDIYSMNAYPSQILVGLSVSNRFSLEAVEELYSGILLACEKYKVDLVGGDTTTSLTGMSISVTAIGQVDEDKYVLRSTAKPNDLLCVSGNLGSAYLGLLFLEREYKLFLENPKMQPDLIGKDYLLERQLKPEARKDIIDFFYKNNIKPTSMIDISDGLSSEIIHLCSNSKVGCIVYQKKIPIDIQLYDKADEFKINPYTCALNGGEDYELLFTISPKDFDVIKTNKEIKVIGFITEDAKKCHYVDDAENYIPLVNEGWDSIKKK